MREIKKLEKSAPEQGWSRHLSVPFMGRNFRLQSGLTESTALRSVV